MFVPILPFLARHDVKWRPCISTLRSIDIMTQVCYEGTYLGAQHILDPAINSSLASYTVAAMLAIWDYPKSWAHLATLPFPIPEELGDAQKICWTHMTSYQSYGTLRSESGMCLICPNHECAHFWPF